jgi:hypothetical protein
LQRDPLNAFDVNLMGNVAWLGQPKHVSRVLHPKCLYHALRGVQDGLLACAQVSQADFLCLWPNAALSDKRMPSEFVIAAHLV